MASDDLPAARRHVEALLSSGEPLLAYEEVGEALARWPDDLRLRQLRGVALNRSGAPERANQALRELRDEGHADGETLGILARSHRDLAARATTSETRDEHLEQALCGYREGYAKALRQRRSDDAWFTGINAATLSLLSGDGEGAAKLAGEVRSLCRTELAHQPRAASHWLHATLAEAALLLGDRAEAEAHYTRSAELAAARPGDLSATRRQARLVLTARGEDPAWLDALLRVPPVFVCTGHMIDHPDRKEPRFPADREEATAAAIAERVRCLAPGVGYASAACGADLLFLEALLAERREIHVILPFPRAEFLAASVDFPTAGKWRERFERVLAAAASVTTTSDHQASGSAITYLYAGYILTGMAALHAQRLETDLVGIAVWDGRPGDGAGGTGDVVARWQSLGVDVARIDPLSDSAGERTAPGADAPRAEVHATAADEPHRLMSMLYADGVGYSRLTEDQIPLFVQHFLGPVAELIEQSPAPPVLKETAGDGFYFVFEAVRDAGLFALALQDRLNAIDWTRHGLPATLGLRVALHSGPVFEITDPITRQQKFTGPHVSRVARIEPITPPGHVYASEAFAAVAAATGVEELGFEYVGRTVLAKRYGSLPLYHVRRAEVAENPVSNRRCRA